jgi:hypothetical protein
MDLIEIKTLVDITKTKATRVTQGSQLEQDQYRNFMTLCQCLEIRSIISYDHAPSMELVDIKNLGFGNKYQGTHCVWTFRFSPDRSGVYLSEDGNPTGYLIEDLDLVPVIKNLQETVNIDKAIFNCNDENYKNIIVRAYFAQD